MRYSKANLEMEVSGGQIYTSDAEGLDVVAPRTHSWDISKKNCTLGAEEIEKHEISFR